MTEDKQENCEHGDKLKQTLFVSALQQKNENTIFYIWNPCSDIFRVNAAFMRVFGGKRVSFPEFKQRVSSKDFEKLERAAKENLDKYNATIPLRLQVEDGEYVCFAMCIAQVVEESILGTLEPLTSDDAQQEDLNYLVHERRQFALEAAEAGLWDWDARTNEVYYDQKYTAMAGYLPSEFSSTFSAWAEKIHPDDYDETVNKQLQYVENADMGDFYTCKYRFRAANGKYIWFKEQGKVLSRDANGRAERIVGLQIDITKEEESKTQFEFMATHDALTGLHNRAYFEQQIVQYNSNLLPSGYIVIDADGLKMVNDCVNHATGDLMLQKLARTLRFSLRSLDMLARVGGDEFAIFLPCTGKDNVIKIAKKIYDEIEANNKPAKGIPVRASVGWAYATTAEELLALAVRADEAMLEQKKIQRPESLKKIQEWIDSFSGRSVAYKDKRVKQD